MCVFSSQVITQADPDLVALHCQEIGGKDFEIQMHKVTEFVRYVHVQTALSVLCCFTLFVCLTLLVFLPSHLSFKNMYK